LIAVVNDNSPELMSYLEVNHSQLMDWIEKLRLDTNNEEDLALFNIPSTDNRLYKSLKQYYLQNGLAPKPPRITSWMRYYLLKHPMMTEEEIVIEDSEEPKELGKKLDVSTIEDAVDTTSQYWTPTEVRVASRYKELRNHDINKAETYLIDQIRSGFVSRKFNPLEVKV